MRTKRKMTAVIICILFAVLFACYGFWMSGNGSGTGFFLIWFVLAALLGGCAAITFLDGWARIYRCDCGYVEDRDFNAALNLRDALTYEVA